MSLEENTKFNYLRINTLNWNDLKNIEGVLNNSECTFESLKENPSSKKLMNLIALANPNFFNFVKKQKK